jgi:hypothetical protein
MQFNQHEKNHVNYSTKCTISTLLKTHYYQKILLQ